jgi:hypothetical protein
MYDTPFSFPPVCDSIKITGGVGACGGNKESLFQDFAFAFLFIF